MAAGLGLETFNGGAVLVAGFGTGLEMGLALAFAAGLAVALEAAFTTGFAPGLTMGLAAGLAPALDAGLGAGLVGNLVTGTALPAAGFFGGDFFGVAFLAGILLTWVSSQQRLYPLDS